jgi:hypothetical protein
MLIASPVGNGRVNGLKLPVSYQAIRMRHLEFVQDAGAPHAVA